MPHLLSSLICSVLIWSCSEISVAEEKPELAEARAKFQSYLEKRPSPEANQALFEVAITWANVEGASAQVEELVRKIPVRDDVWPTILIGYGNAFGRDGRYDRGMELLTELEPRIIPMVSRSAVLVTLARYWHSKGMTDKAVKAYERILTWAPSPELSLDAKRGLREINELAIGRPAPDFSCSDLAGNKFALSDHRGDIVVIDFWATWCGPCQPEIPYLRSVASKHPAIVMITIAKDDDPDKVRAKLNVDGIGWPHVLDGMRDGKLSELYNADAIPRVFVVDREGKIAAKDLRGEALVSAIDQLVK